MEIKQFIDPEQLQRDCAVNDTNLSGEMMKQASLYAHYAVLAARAQRQADNAKMQLEIIEARVDKVIRDTAAETGEKITEAGITKKISRNVDYVKALNALNEAKMIAELARQALEALRHKRDMLIQMGLNQREEMKGELFIRQRDAAEIASQEKRARTLEMLKGAVGS